MIASNVTLPPDRFVASQVTSLAWSMGHVTWTFDSVVEAAGR